MKVLVCSLNWGLGHASRCIPIIYQQMAEGNEVVIAADGYPLRLLRNEFPMLRFIESPSFTVTYSQGNSQNWAMLHQLPSIIKAIVLDHQWLKGLLKIEHFDSVISDNRFGLWNKSIHSIYITHQLMVKMPKALKWAEPILWLLHRIFINLYTECWIPDKIEGNKLAGDLAHKYPLPTHAKIVGILSRFQSLTNLKPSHEYTWVAVLSGIEPQRTLLEKKVLERFSQLNEPCLLIKGLPLDEVQTQKIGRTTIVSHLPSAEMAAILLGANHIIARSGYSTIMDLEALGCLHKAELIPTPGQTEQEYLLENLKQNF